MDQLVQRAMEAIARKDWDLVKEILHPYIQWTDGPTKIRGRTNVLAHLATHSAPEPTTYEVRDGQIYRWTG